MRISLTKIKKELIKTHSGNLPENTIAVAVTISEDNTANHAALLIGVNGEYSVFHFLPDDILMSGIEEVPWLYHKELSIFPPDQSQSFLFHCELIQQTSNVQYGFIFDGSYYKDGVYFSMSGLPEYSTCVGFCINVISGYLYDNPKYFEVSDWEAIPIDEGRFQEYFAKAKENDSDLDEELFKAHHKRIRPEEYLAAAYFDLGHVPIRKEKIDSIISNVAIVVGSKRAES